MLAQKWKSGGGAQPAGRGRRARGQVRSFKIISLDPAQKQIELELV